MIDDAALARISAIAEEVKTERLRAERLWGHEFDSKNNANDWASFITAYVGKATQIGRDVGFTAECFRANMLKVSAIAQAAIAALDSVGMPGTHYQTLVNKGAQPDHTDLCDTCQVTDCAIDMGRTETCAGYVKKVGGWICPRCNHQNKESDTVCKYPGLCQCKRPLPARNDDGMEAYNREHNPDHQ